MEPFRVKTRELIVKLKVREDETRLIRGNSLFKFVNLKYGDGSDGKAYSRLIDLAIKYAQGNNFDINATREDFAVKTTYIDIDGDKITFSTEEEFRDAVNFTKKVLRVNAEVQKKGKVLSNGKTCNDASKDKSTYAMDDLMKNVMKSIKDVSQAQEKFTAGVSNDLKNVRERLDLQEKVFVRKEVFSDALEELKKQNQKLKEAIKERVESSLWDQRKSSTCVKNSTHASKSSNTMRMQLRPKWKHEQVISCPPLTSSPLETFPDHGAALNISSTLGSVLEKNLEGLASKKDNKQETTKPCMVRHRGIRCDGCDMVPIIGNRYHSTNLPDYDLCEKCHQGMKETNIKFSVIEKPMSQRCINKYVETFPTKPVQKRNNCVPAQKSKKLNPDFIHGRHTCDGCLKSPIVGLRYNSLSVKDYDLCSECFAKTEGSDIAFEAVELERDRNRQHVWKKKVERKLRLSEKELLSFIVPPAIKIHRAGEVPPTKTFHQVGKNMKVNFVVRAEEDLFYEGSENTVRRVKAGERSEGYLHTDFSQFFSSFSKNNKLRESDLDYFFGNKIKKSDTPTSIRIKDGDVISVRMKKGMVKDSETLKIASSPNPIVNKPCEKKDDIVKVRLEKEESHKAHEKGLIDCKDTENQLDSEDKELADEKQASHVQVKPIVEDKIESNESGPENKNQISEEVTSHPKEVVAPSILKDSISEIECSQDSFAASEKEGNDVESLFEQIEPLEVKENEEQQKEETQNSEEGKLEMNQKVDDSEKVEDMLSVEDNECVSEDEKAEELPEINLNHITSDDVIMDEISSGTADEWDMIEEQNEQIDNDEVLARAAQLVGSALFEEDNSKSESFYSLLSIESDIPLAVATRWQNELVQLREIGFVDDKESVSVLEELQAANIGVDSNEPIQIEKVVDRLLLRK